MTITFTVYGEAVPQRERSFVAGGRMGRYITKETRNWRAVIKAQAVAHKPEVLPTGAIRLAVEFVLPRPGYLMAPKYYWRCKSRKCGWKGTELEAVQAKHDYVKARPGQMHIPLESVCPRCDRFTQRPEPTPLHTVKPDFDNLSKSTVDALSGLFWTGDQQLNHVEVDKRWAELGEQPCVAIAVTFEPSGDPEEA